MESYKNHEYYLDVEKIDGEWKASLDYYDEDIFNINYSHKNKYSAIKGVKKIINSFIDDNKSEVLYQNDYRIFFHDPNNIFKNIYQGCLYHVSEASNRDSIKKYGLMPNYSFDEEVYYGSVLVDYHKPSGITFQRTLSVYFYFELSNYFFHPERKNVDLWVAELKNLNTEKMLFGSQGLAGFCMSGYYNMKNAELNYKKYKREADFFAKKYWQHTFTYKEFMNNDHHKSDKYWGIDECVYNNNVDKKYIKHIGSWDETGKFTLVNNFKKYIVRNDYQEVIDNYQKYYKEIEND